MGSRTVTVTDCVTRYVDSRYPDMGYSTDIIKADHLWGYNGTTYQQVILIRFDTLSVKGGRIRRAHIYLYLTQADIDIPAIYHGTVYIRGNALKQGFDIANATYTSMEAGYDDAEDIRGLDLLSGKVSVDTVLNEYQEIYVVTSSAGEDVNSRLASVIANNGAGIACRLSSSSSKALVTYQSERAEHNPYMKIIIEDIPLSCINLSPSFASVDRTQPHTFSWDIDYDNTYVVGSIKQTAADLQYSLDNVEWQSLTFVSGETQSAEIPANTLPVGRVYWRVRAYNYADEAGEWSGNGELNVYEAARPPIITETTSGTARPVISWSAHTQYAYELIISHGTDEIWRSGIVLGVEKSQKIGIYLSDGNYTAKLRVYGSDGVASEWVTANFIVYTQKPSAPVLTALPIEGGVLLTATAEGAATVYILRDGVVIGQTESGIYRDFAAAGKGSYVARTVSAADTFADSKTVDATPKIPCTLLARVSALADFVRLRLNKDTYPTRSLSWVPVGSKTHYAGREFPVFEYNGQSDEEANYTFSFLKRQEFLDFLTVAQSREVLLLREKSGAKFYGVVTGVNWEVTPVSVDVTFSFSRTGYTEGIAYD